MIAFTFDPQATTHEKPSQPAVRDGQLVYTSPSAIAKFDPSVEGGCPTRWWLRYVKGEKEPQTIDQKDGVEGHSQLEFYGRTGDDVLGPIARAGKHLIHPPAPDAMLEVPLEKLTADGLKVIGYVDRINLSGKYVDHIGRLLPEENTPEVIDYKFISDLKWAKRGPELLTTQMVAYAEELRIKNPDARGFRLSHIYFQKRGKRVAFKSTEVFTTGQIGSSWRIRGDAVVRQMRGVVGLDFEKVPRQFSSCSTFGGCPFRKVCHKSPLAQLRASVTTKGNVMGLLAKVKAITAGSPPPAVAQGNGASPSVVAPSLPPPASGRKMEIQDVGVSGTPERRSDVPSAFGTLGIAKCELGGTYIVKEDGTRGEYTGSSKEFGFFQLASGALRLPLTAKVNPLPPPAPVALPPVETAAQEKPKRSRAKSETPGAIPEKGIRLFLNCIPSGSYESIDPYVNGAAKELGEQFQMDDIRFATDNDHPLAFGRWKGALSVLVRSKLPADGSYVAFTMGSELVQVVTEAILPHATFIVRGVR